MKLHDYLTFSKSERRAIIFLLAVIVVLAIVLSGKKKESTSDIQLAETKHTTSAEIVFDEASQPFAFNPNTADSATLRAVGLSPFVSSNIVKYRRAGGRFRRPADLARIYGMDSAAFARIKPYIYIPKEDSPRPSRPSSPKNPPDVTQADSQAYQPSPYKEYMENKLPAGVFLDLNKADSADLVRIPGIGPYFASHIVSLRRQLGGYVSLSQLSDIPNLPEIGDYVYVEEGAQQRIKVNSATLRTLTRHPYIGYYRAKAIMDIRHRDGRVVSLRQLSFLDEFSDEDIQRLAPYLSFE
jgi:DNA uptake protein ComE-like DNA-binding protein